MKLQLDRPDVLAPTQRFPELDGLQEQLRFGHRIEIRSRALPLDALEFLARLYEDVVAGKCGGTTVLCAGPPGVGKLVAKFCQHKALQPALDVFARCAMLRALAPVGLED